MNKRKQKGFSLIEIMVTSFIVAFGILGMAALQLKSLQAAHSAYQRTIASVIAMDVVERLWANMAMDTPLTETQLQEQSLAHWQQTANSRQSLPGLGLTLTNATGTNTYVITVDWGESRFGENDVPSQFIYSVDLYPGS
ncbi:type IV pilus modification protein PilV [Shewanella sp. MR-4]|uniref:Type IV pilus modification protein PilV n=1 Tax=Shewanella sp. (strain MR-7) TaxID=60481 RepID=Q0HRV3_SHESR|nr:type IV pilus modification protein PilV [Shewanella sp. MR-4]ABI37934.1 type IV pilus modification protein PilV [Shewanella sp. MR-4]